jgi:NhaP-type Na+/H+ or K+/H+ antiporter
LAVDLAYPVLTGILIGGALGTLVGRYILHLRVRKAALGYNDFLALGLLGITYGVAHLCHANGFLAVFAAGCALRRLEMSRGEEPRHETLALPVSEALRERVSASPEKGPIYLTESILAFLEHHERLGEFAIVTLFGALFAPSAISVQTLGLAALIFFVIRPLSVYAGLAGSGVTPIERRLSAWFGLRGIGSIFYLSYAISHGLKESDARALSAFALVVIAASIFLHGVTVTPLMRAFREKAPEEAETGESVAR